MSLFLSSRCLVVFLLLLTWVPWWIRLQCCQTQDGKSNSCQNSQLSEPEASFNPIGRQQRPGDWGGPGGPPFGRLVLIMQRLAFPQTCFDPSGFSLRSSPNAPNNNCFLVVSTIIKRYIGEIRACALCRLFGRSNRKIWFCSPFCKLIFWSFSTKLNPLISPCEQAIKYKSVIPF